MIENLINRYTELLGSTSMSESMVIFIENASIIVVTVILAWLADFLLKKIIIGLIGQLARRTKTTWEDVFVRRGVFNRLGYHRQSLSTMPSSSYLKWREWSPSWRI